MFPSLLAQMIRSPVTSCVNNYVGSVSQMFPTYMLCCRKSLLVPFGQSLLQWQFLGGLSLHLTFSAAVIAGTTPTEYGAQRNSYMIRTSDYSCKLTHICLLLLQHWLLTFHKEQQSSHIVCVIFIPNAFDLQAKVFVPLLVFSWKFLPSNESRCIAGNSARPWMH